ncbi:MAG TPA: molybdopterin-dependent oxidoreductase, partial [Candidatus Binataceae bacterium]|nr:molybdopterin-dependent oxidoreductase [Candidatus Binataceae bacterium]
ADKFAMAVRRGKADDFLIKAEKAPNARGIREMGLVSGADDGLDELVRAAEAGELKGLYLCGGDLLDVLAPERLEALLGRMEVLIVHALRADPRLARATVIFPTTTFAEKDGSFTNHAGRVQRIFKAIETPPGWLGDAEVFTRIWSALDGEERRFNPQAVWESIARTHPRFAGLSLEAMAAAGAMLDGSAARGAAHSTADH